MTTPKVKYYGETDELFHFVQTEQLFDVKTWKLLEKQFRIKKDSTDGGWRGEFWGKLMRGAALVYSYTQDDKLYLLLTDSVKRLFKHKDKLGVLSTYNCAKQFTSWDMWCRKYVMLGLEYYLEICKDQVFKQEIIKTLIVQADYILKFVGEGKLNINQTSKIWGCLNSYSVLQPFVKLYKITKEEKYLEFAKYIISSQDIEGLNFFELAYNNKFAPYKYPIVKAYEMISCFEGLLEFYELVGNQDAFTACINFADRILETDFTIVGGTGCRGEYFDNSKKRQVLNDPSIEMQETCVTVTLMKFLAELYLHTKNVKYADAIERSYFNLYLGTVNKNYKQNKYPLFLSYSPITCAMRYDIVGGKKDISITKFFGCCISIAAAGLGALNKNTALYEENENSVYINSYLAADYEFNIKNSVIKLKVLGDYPNEGKISIKINPNITTNFKFRIPDWCQDFSVKINGEPIVADVVDNYLTLNDVSKEINVELELCMPLKVIKSDSVNQDINYRVAFTKGPIVLAQDKCQIDCAYDFDFLNASIEEKKVLGEKIYKLTLNNGEVLPLKKYSDCAKEQINKDMLNVWFRFNKRK